MNWREDFGLWWPDDEADKHFAWMLNRVTDVDLTLAHIQSKGICVQAGGFIGMWAVRLAKFFERVHVFEPIGGLFACLRANTAHLPGVRCHNVALGASNGVARIEYRKGGGSQSTGAGSEYEHVTIDSLGLTRCDAIYLDVEGSELDALKGAAGMIERFRPVITVERWPAKQPELQEWLKRRHYSVRAEAHADQIWVAGKVR